jgi:3-dehydroquinate synthase
MASPCEHNPASPPRGVEARFSVAFAHRLLFVRDALRTDGAALREMLGPGSHRVAVFLDGGVVRHWPALAAEVEAYAAAHDEAVALVGGIHVVPGGEAAKNDWTVVNRVVSAIDRGGLCRHSFVIAIGGGAMLDAVGYGAATAHRGVRLVRMPTTTLAQGDGGVGVKNGINLLGKKNFVGCFAPPWAVINDERYLETLDDRDWRCGFSEAVKVALLKDAALFDRIELDAARIARRDPEASRPVIRRCAELHLDHIVHGGDPFETEAARPLDFGHWSAHKIEQMSCYRVKHGEAVAIGLALDVVYAARAGLLGWSDADRVLAVLRALGFALTDETLACTDELLGGLEEFREHLGGRLAITLLTGIGAPVEVDEIDTTLVREAIERLES